MKKLGFLATMASILTISVGSPARAHIVMLGVLRDSTPYVFTEADSRATFSDRVTFRLGGSSSLKGSIIESGANPFSVSLDSVAGMVGERRLSPSLVDESFSFSDLAPGAHTLTFNGSGPAFSRGVLSVAAVPEAETWLMMVIGLGLVIFQLRRTQRSLQHRTLAG